MSLRAIAQKATQEGYRSRVMLQICTFPANMPYCCLLVKEVKMVLIPVRYPHSQSDQVIKGGKTKAGQALWLEF